MALLADRANEYFASINPLAQKIAEDIETVKELHGQNHWASLGQDEQDAILDDYFMGTDDKNAVIDDGQNVFPRLKINCGEKIVVDFDKDGWTWRDEHSGPFSWETRSQQDLPMLESVDEGIGKEISSRPKVPSRKSKSRTRSPKVDGVKTGLERSIWESPFLKADSGFDSGYPSSHTSEHSKSSGEDSEEKLSICALGRLEEQDHVTHHNEDTQLLDICNGGGDWSNKLGALRVDTEVDNSEGPPSVSPDFSSNRISKHREDKQACESGQALMSDLDIALDHRNDLGLDRRNDLGQVSPVFIEDSGETSTDWDAVVTQQPVSQFGGSLVSPPVDEIGGQINLALDESTDVDDQNGETNQVEDDSSVIRSGYSFLDDW